jgi:hypothetical protein
MSASGNGEVGGYTLPMSARGVTPILNVSDITASFAWFEKWGWKKLWDWGTPPSFGAVGSGSGAEIFLCRDAQGGRGKGGERRDVWTGWRSSCGQGHVDVGLGGRRRRGPSTMRCRWARCHFPTDRHAVAGSGDARSASGRPRISRRQRF